MDLVGVLGLIALILGILVVIKVIAWGIPIGIILIIVGLIVCLGGFGQRFWGGRRVP